MMGMPMITPGMLKKKISKVPREDVESPTHDPQPPKKSNKVHRPPLGGVAMPGGIFAEMKMKSLKKASGSVKKIPGSPKKSLSEAENDSVFDQSDSTTTESTLPVSPKPPSNPPTVAQKPRRSMKLGKHLSK